MQQGARPWALALIINSAPAELGKDKQQKLKR